MAFRFNLVLIIGGILLFGVIAPLLPSILPPYSCPGPNPCIPSDPDDAAHGIALFGVAVLFVGLVLEIVRRKENQANLDMEMNEPSS